MRRAIFVLAVLPSLAASQTWEIGAGGGYGVYRRATVFSDAGTIDAGIRNRFALTVWATHHMYEHVSGEVRYVYQDGDPFLASGGRRFNVQGQSHTAHYDVLIHLRPRRARVRPYFAAGLGAKRYVVSGPVNPVQPFSSIARLTSQDTWRFVFDGGAGVSVALTRHLAFRADFHDYVTTFPRPLIAPAPLATGRGFFQQFTPMVGLAGVF